MKGVDDMEFSDLGFKEKKKEKKMELTKDDLKERIRCWLRIYVEWAERFYDLKNPKGKKAFKKFEERQYDIRNKIESTIDLLRE